MTKAETKEQVLKEAQKEIEANARERLLSRGIHISQKLATWTKINR